MYREITVEDLWEKIENFYNKYNLKFDKPVDLSLLSKNFELKVDESVVKTISPTVFYEFYKSILIRDKNSYDYWNEYCKGLSGEDFNPEVSLSLDIPNDDSRRVGVVLKADSNHINAIKSIYPDFKSLCENNRAVRTYEYLKNGFNDFSNLINRTDTNIGYKIIIMFIVFEEYYDSIEAAKFEEIIMDTKISAELRSLVLRKTPVEYLTEVLDKVDVYVGKDAKDIYELFKGNILNTDLAFVRCYDFSSDRMFLLGVESNYTSAKDAIASLVEIPEGLHDYIDGIYRQGEIFSITFTLDVESDLYEELSNTPMKSLNGDLYFSKMKFQS